MTQSHHCRNFRPTPISRRQMLQQCANGFGAVALAGLCLDQAPGTNAATPLLTAKPPLYRPRARHIIFLYMDGGPAQMDTFDPKPRLTREHGQPFKMKMEPTQFNDNGNTFASPWAFHPRGRSGLPISELFPEIAKHADDLCVIRSMVSEFSEHTTANYFLHTGLGLAGRPSMGAWVNYGLGTENQNLPGYIILNGGLVPPGGLDNFSSGFLPASYQGSIFQSGSQPLANIVPKEPAPHLQRHKLNLIEQLDRVALQKLGRHDALESSIRNYELAFRMQAAVPDLVDINREPPALKERYGFNSTFEPTRIFANQCLLARRLVERGVRFIELTCPSVNGADRWDQHSNLKDGHQNNARAVDQPISALLADLKSRGLLEETLVVWAGEFGRTPFAQGSNGRDHNPFSFSIWLAGGGVRGGMAYGATDDYGYKVIENRVTMHDLHATMLHLLGVDHTQLTYRFGGRDMRLTDVHGEIIRDILA